MTEEMEENENLNKFLSFFQHFDAVPVQQEIPENTIELQNVTDKSYYFILKSFLFSGLSRLFKGEKSAKFYQIWKKVSRSWE